MTLVLSRFLLRAPLLPLSALEGNVRTTFAKDLPAAALALSNVTLSDGRGGAGAARALHNYARRAAFRPTPHGLWAGVGLGALGERTAIQTGPTRAHLTVSWARLAALGRALLDDEAGRLAARLRLAPSLLEGGDHVRWLHGDRVSEAERDVLLDEVLAACAAWRPWAEVRAAVATSAGGDEAELDEYLLLLVDGGLLHHDLEPPLLGPPPLDWMRARLGGAQPALDELAALLTEPAPAPAGTAARVRAARELLAQLPGAVADGPSLHAVLVHEPARALLSRVAVERAVAVAPLLFRLQDALAPPAAERSLDASLLDAVDTVSEVFGAGALDLAALALGEYGTPLTDETATSERPAAPPSLLALLVERLVGAAAAGEIEIRLDPAELDALLPPTALPPSYELVLTPAREPRRATPGTDWLLGLHAPAGASWGRYTDAVGPSLGEALQDLAEAEALARPGEERLDVAFAPSAALADLAAHPPLRRRALALSSWPTGAQGAITAADLALVVDGAAAEPLALRAGEQPVAPSPLHRLRSTMTPPGLFRLLAGWSLYRQHAPWALQLGPLAGLPRLPRVRLEGFVVAPASWRIPALQARADLRRWRRDAGLPRFLQVGHEDELLLIDLDDEEAALAAIARLPGGEDRPRAFEVWPPLDATPDVGGRRVEAVVAVIEDETAAAATVAIAATRAAGRVTPPSLEPAAEGWRTFKLFGAADRADRLLALDLAPVLRALARGRARRVDRWFFLRYVDGPGRRDHLRLRLHVAPAGDLGAIEAELSGALAAARARGDLVTIETAEYHRELARFGGARALDAIEQIFEADSDLCLTLLALSPPPDPTPSLVLALDGIAAGCGLDLAARRDLAGRRRAAYASLLLDDDDALRREYRQRQRQLVAALAAPPAAPFARHRRLVAAAVRRLPEATVAAALPTLLHLCAVRHAGVGHAEEARAVYLWERALEGVHASR